MICGITMSSTTENNNTKYTTENDQITSKSDEGNSNANKKETKFIVDADSIRRIQPLEYFRHFTDQKIRPNGRVFNRFRKTTLHLGFYLSLYCLTIIDPTILIL